MFCRAAAALVASLAFLTFTAAAEKYTLKTSTPDRVGDRTQVTKTETVQAVNTVLDESGKVVESQKKSEEARAVYLSTVLAEENKRMTRFSRCYEKATRKLDGTPQELDLDGKTVIVELKDKKYRFTLENGGTLTDAALDMLNEEFKNKDDDDDIEKLFMPAGPVAVGESWKCDVKEIVKSMMPELGAEAVDVAKATGIGILRKVYAKEGHTFGMIDVTLELPLLSFGESGDMIKADAGSKMTIKFNLDACIDGSQTAGTMTAKLEVVVSGTIDAGGQKVTVKSTVTMDATETKKPVR